jgi:hypothetical protein
MSSRLANPDLQILAVCATIIAAALLLPAPASRAPGISIAGKLVPSTCSFHTVTGLDCPFCGITRSMVALAHGRWSDSISFHPLGPALLVFLLAQIFYRAGRLLRGPAWPAPETVTPAFRLAPFTILIAAFLVVWIIKLIVTFAQMI